MNSRKMQACLMSQSVKQTGRLLSRSLPLDEVLLLKTFLLLKSVLLVLIYYSDVLNKISCYTALVE